MTVLQTHPRSRPALHGGAFVLAAVLTLGLAGTTQAQPGPAGDGTGQIQLPLAEYNALKEQLRLLEAARGASPVGVTLSRAEVRVQAATDEAATVRATVTVHILSEDWVQVPLLPAGTAVERATSDGEAIALLPIGGQLVWTVKGAGKRDVVLDYRTARGGSGPDGSLSVPVPAAAAIALNATLPGDELRVEAIPGRVTARSGAGGQTQLTAVIPRTSHVLLSWHRPATEAWLITGATYEGDAGEQTVRWRAAIALRTSDNAPVAVPVLPGSAAVSEATLDGAPAVLEERGGRLVVWIRGAGDHTLEATFETAILSGEGPTSTALWLPRPPVVSMRLALAGDKEVSVSPHAGVVRSVADGRTVATVHLPPTSDVTFQWSESFPEEVDQAVRTTAEVFHMVRAEEGVLQLSAHVDLAVTRGKTHTLSFLVPSEAVVNAVEGEGVNDWRVLAAAPDAPGLQRVEVYLDRELSQAYRFVVSYERLLGAGAEDAAYALPLLRMFGVHRQRGMVALSRGRELEIAPAATQGMNAVGENQLPAWFKDTATNTLTHTYKYVDETASLEVRLAPFERERARYDARLDTLFSIADGVLRAAATVSVTVKAGGLAQLEVTLPAGINVLSASAPSLREHEEVTAEDGSRVLKLTFTREMTGQVKVELAWERVLGPDEEQVPVPMLHVVGANLEQGRLGVEALTAVEVAPAEVLRLQPMDVGELPRQLVLRTTNPILLAYKYVHADPPAALSLLVKRHTELAVQVAAIDDAQYTTLITRSGVALTQATWRIRNRGQQFLQIKLPEGATVWSAALDGQPVKPARSAEAGSALVPLLSSTKPFTVELSWIVQGEPLGSTGAVEVTLPSPDVVETETRWELFVPADVDWTDLATNMTVVSGLSAHGTPPPDLTQNADAEGRLAEGQGPGALRIAVPRRGKRLVLSKVLANQGAERPQVRLAFAGKSVRMAGSVLVFVGGLLMVLALLRLIAFRRERRIGPLIAGVLGVAAAVIGAVAMGATLAWLAAGALAGGLVWTVSWVLGRGRPQAPMPAATTDATTS